MRYTPSLLTGIALCIVSLSLGSAASAQSLGDLARKEQERRKTVPTGKVYTNDSLGSPAPAPPPAPTSSQPASAQDQSKTAGDKAAGEKPAGEKPAAPEGAAKDEAYWRARIQGERDAVERSKVLLDALQSRISALQTDFVNRDDPAARTVITAERQRALAELERINLDIKQRTQAIADIQEEARRAGAPAAWYR
jgi:hypothetical protein